MSRFRQRALQDMYDLAVSAYGDQMTSVMLPRARELLGVDGLQKAVKPLLTPERLREIARVIHDNHVAVLLRLGMRDEVLVDEVERLVAADILPADAADVLHDSYLLGQLAASVRQLDEQVDVDRLTYPELRALVARRPIALTDQEQRAIEWSRHSAAVHIRALADRATADFSRAAIDADAELRRVQRATRQLLEENAERRGTVRELAQDLGNSIGDWSRDFGRIAATEKQQAFQEGFAQRLEDEEGPPQGIYVAKIPAPTACPDCVRLHLQDGLGSRPRVFRLSELMANGTNRGRKRDEWRATVGTVHPWCWPAGGARVAVLAKGEAVGPSDFEWRAVENVRVGDRVLTHADRFKRVTRVSRRPYVGSLTVLRLAGQSIRCTPEHPLLTGRGWVKAGEVVPGDHVMHSLRVGVTKPSAEAGKIFGVVGPLRVAAVARLASSGAAVGEVSYLGVPVESVDREPYVGSVHNFAVEEDESYVADGWVSHNCACELVHVPAGWDFERAPRRGEPVTKVKGRDAWEHQDGRPWRPRLLPDTLRRGEGLRRDLLKSFLRYDNVPDHGLTVRVHDPEILAAVDAVAAETPAWLFDKDVGVTLVTWDHPRAQVALEDHDLAYWTGNEVRLAHGVTPDKVQKILRHEFGHALNVYLVRKWGGERPVREWHDKLYKIAQAEGFVSAYARVLPIECAAEVTRLYLYERKKLMLEYPRQFAEVHAAYRELGRSKSWVRQAVATP